MSDMIVLLCYEDGEHAPPARKVETDFGFQRVAVIAML